MTDRERLIELMKKGYENVPVGGFVYEGIADHLLDNGVIVPPCKVGDTVYYPWIYDGQCGVAFSEVESIKIYVNRLPIAIVEDWQSDMPMPTSFTIEDFGETIFLTREEAEKALAERGGAE